MTALSGLDVSHHNGHVDWRQVATAGYRFAYLKATEGTSYTDTTHATHRPAARAAGLLVGLYHFAKPGESTPIAQARHFADTIGPLGPGDLPPALDLEDAGGLSPRALTGWALTFLQELARIRPERAPIVYTYPAFRTQQLAGGHELLGKYRLWWARYAEQLPSGDPHPLIWQRTDRGSVPGINGRVDLDAFMGTPAQLEQLAGLTPASPSPHPASSSSSSPASSPATATEEPPVHVVNLRHAHEQLVTGPGVRALQALLILGGFLRGPADGRAGLGTRTALCAFQKANGLPVDAIAGRSTWTALVSL